MEKNLEVLWLAENRYHPGAGLKEHLHEEFYQVYCIMEGKAAFRVNGEQADVEQGMIVLLTPGTPHGILPVLGDAAPSLRLLEAKFTVQEDTLREELSRIPPVCRGTEKLCAQFYDVFLEGVRKDVHYESVVTGLFSAWLYRLIRHAREFEADGTKGDISPRVTTRIKRYLEAHFREEVSLDRLAEATGYSKNYLCRVFRENAGLTINNYLNEVRISRAVDLLVGTDMDLGEIAQACGYNSVYYFIKSFKKRIGIPPGSYRKSELIGVDLVEGQVDSVNSAMRASEVLLMRINETE